MVRVAATLMVLLLASLLAASGASAQPRPIEAAIPGNCRSAIYLHEFATELEPAIDSLEQILDSAEALDFIDTAPLPAMALESLGSQDSLGLDRRGGLALFRPASAGAVVGVVAVTDGKAAIAALTKALRRQEVVPLPPVDGLARYRVEADLELAAFVEGGFLYLVMPDTDLLPGQEGTQARFDVNATVATLKKELNAPLSVDPLFEKVRARVAGRGVQLFWRAPFGEGSAVEGALTSATFDAKGTHVDGFIATRSEVLTPTKDAVPKLLAKAPAGAAIVFSSGVGGSELPLFLGGLAHLIGQRLDEQGISPALLLSAFTGATQAAFYLDPELFIADATSGRAKVGPIGTVLLSANATNVSSAKTSVLQILRARGRVVSANPARTRIRAEVEGQPVDVRMDGEKVQVRAGPPLRSSMPVDLVAQFREGLPAGSFGLGHVTLVVDAAQMRNELEPPPNEPESDEELVSRFVASAVNELTALDRIALDLGPELGGARLTLELTYGAAYGHAEQPDEGGMLR